MADVLTRVETVDNTGATVATFGANAYKNRISQSDAGREIVLSLASNSTINDAELNAAISEVTRSQGSAGSGDSAFTVAAVGTADGSAFVAGTTTDVFLRVQGTGDLTVASVKAAAEGVTGGNATTFTVTIPAIFTPAK